MMSIASSVGDVLVANALLAASTAGAEIERDYRFPTRIYAVYEGKEYPVAGVEKKRPYIELEGKRQKLKARTGYRITRGPRYAEGSVDFSVIERNDVEPILDKPVESPVGSLIDFNRVKIFETEVVAREDLENCYALLVVYDPISVQFQESDATRRILFKELGDLEKGKATRLRIDLEGTDFGMLGLQAFPVIYSNNREVLSEITDFVSSYARRLDLAAHHELVARYLARLPDGESLALSCYRLFPAIPTRTDRLSHYPKTAIAEVEVGADGIVKSIDLDDELPEFVGGDAIESLRDWLFLPRLKDGEAVEAKGKIEIAFAL